MQPPFVRGFSSQKGGFFHEKISQSLERRFVGFVEPSNQRSFAFQDRLRAEARRGVAYAKTNKAAGAADRRATASALSAEITGAGILQ